MGTSLSNSLRILTCYQNLPKNTVPNKHTNRDITEASITEYLTDLYNSNLIRPRLQKFYTQNTLKSQSVTYFQKPHVSSFILARCVPLPFRIYTTLSASFWSCELE